LLHARWGQGARGSSFFGFWQSGLRGQIYLGDDEFAARMQGMAQSPAATQREIPKRQRMAPRTWAQCLADCGGDRDAALHTAYCRHGWTMTALAQTASLSVSRVSRLIAAVDRVLTQGLEQAR
jgi:putative transposase